MGCFPVRGVFPMGRALPRGAREVEYVEANGTQFVQLPFAFIETDWMRIDTALLANVSGTYYLHGQNTTGNGRFALGKGAGTWNDWYFGLGDKNLRTGVTIDSARHVFELDGLADRARIDGAAFTVGHSSWTASGVAYGATLFRRTQVSTGAGNGWWIGRVWGAQVRHGGASGTPALDLAPVRIGTAGYLWDRVTRTLLGSGDLAPGPDK